jgi:hypothetical protein
VARGRSVAVRGDRLRHDRHPLVFAGTLHREPDAVTPALHEIHTVPLDTAFRSVRPSPRAWKIEPYRCITDCLHPPAPLWRGG